MWQKMLQLGSGGGSNQYSKFGTISSAASKVTINLGFKPTNVLIYTLSTNGNIPHIFRWDTQTQKVYLTNQTALEADRTSSFLSYFAFTSDGLGFTYTQGIDVLKGASRYMAIKE